MKKVLSYTVGCLVAVAALFVFVANFSVVETRYRCSGQMASQNVDQQAMLFIRLEEYRWWVGLWGDSDGSVRLEIPNQWEENYWQVDELGDQLRIASEHGGPVQGMLSKLSGALTMQTATGLFEGSCSVL